MRIVIELRSDVNPQIMLNNLYKHTQMQVNFGSIMLALVDGHPRILNLKQILYYYLKHQEEVITRRSRYELERQKPKPISWKVCSLPLIILTKSSAPSVNRGPMRWRRRR